MKDSLNKIPTPWETGTGLPCFRVELPDGRWLIRQYIQLSAVDLVQHASGDTLTISVENTVFVVVGKNLSKLAKAFQAFELLALRQSPSIKTVSPGKSPVVTNIEVQNDEEAESHDGA